jgi:hypothetical protein
LLGALLIKTRLEEDSESDEDYLFKETDFFLLLFCLLLTMLFTFALGFLLSNIYCLGGELNFCFCTKGTFFFN